MRRTAVSLAWIGASVAASGLARLAFNAIAARRLDGEQFGTVSIWLGWGVGAAAITSAFSQQSAMRFVARVRASSGHVPDVLRPILAWSAVMAILAALIVAASPLVQPVGGQGVLYGSAIAVALLASNYFVVRGLYFGLAASRTQATIELAGAALLVAGAATWIAPGRADWSLVPLLAGYAVWLVPLGAWLPRLVTARPDALLSREIFRYGMVNVWGTAASTGRAYAAPIALGIVAGVAAAGEFAAAFSAAAMLLLFPQAVAMALMPNYSFVLVRHGSQALAARAGRHAGLLGTAALICAPAAVALGDIAMHALFGGRFPREASVAFGILAVEPLALLASRPAMVALAAGTHVRLTALAGVLALVVSSSIWAVFGDAHGLLAFAWGMAIGGAVASLFLVVAAWRRMGVPPIAAAGIAGAVAMPLAVPALGAALDVGLAGAAAVLMLLSALVMLAGGGARRIRALP